MNKLPHVKQLYMIQSCLVISRDIWFAMSQGFLEVKTGPESRKEQMLTSPSIFYVFLESFQGPVLQGSAIMERTLRLVALLRDAEEVKAPKGVPCEGKVVSDSDSRIMQSIQLQMNSIED